MMRRCAAFLWAAVGVAEDYDLLRRAGESFTTPLAEDLPTAFEERLDGARQTHGVFNTVAALESSAETFYERLAARYGRRLQVPRDAPALVRAWPALFGENFEDRGEPCAVVVVLHCFSDARREAALQVWRKAAFRRRRHVFASDRLDVEKGFLGLPDDSDSKAFRVDGDKYLGAHRPLLALLFANDTWGGTFEFLAHGDDDTRFDLGALDGFLGAKNAALPLFLGQPGHRHYGCKPRDGPARAADPFACCDGSDAPCLVDVPREKPYFSFELNRSGTRTNRGAGDGRVIAAPCRRRGRRKPCCPVRQRSREDVFPYRYVPQRGRVHYHNLASWPYGGAGYYVSRGLLYDVRRWRWAACADKLVCGNGDQRVSTCLFNHGYQLSAVERPRALAVHGGPVLAGNASFF